MTVTEHHSLTSLHELGLINAEELEEAIAELDIAAFERRHRPEELVDMPVLADDADQATALAWLLEADLLAPEPLFERLRQRPACKPLVVQALQQVYRQAIELLYQEDLLNQWQRDSAYEYPPSDTLVATPVAAMRWLLQHRVLSPQQLQALQARSRTHGSELARIIVQAAGKPERAAYRRPPAWQGALAVLGMLLVFSCLYAWLAPVAGK